MSKSFLQTVFDKNANVISRIDSGIERSADRYWDSSARANEAPILSRKFWGGVVSAGWNGGTVTLCQKVSKLPFVAACGATKLTAKVTHKPLDTPPKI
jgi:hypothetical protein